MKKRATEPAKKTEKSSGKASGSRLKEFLSKERMIFIAAVIAVAAVYLVLTNAFAICDKGVSVITALVIMCVCGAGTMYRHKLRDKRMQRFLKGTAAACLAAFAAETLVFNFKSFTSDTNGIQYMGFSDIQLNEGADAEIDGEKVIIRGNAELTMELNWEKVNAIQLDFDGNGKSALKCWCAIKDDNFAYENIRIGEKSFSADYGKCDFAFSTYGTLHSVTVGFNDVREPVTLKSIRFSNALPFRFSELRFYSLFLMLTAAWGLYVFGLYKVTYNRKDYRHRTVIAVLTVVMSMTVLFFDDPTASEIDYKNGDLDMAWQNPYVQMFDMIENHRSYIDVTPSEEILAMENPYDNSARVHEGADCAWDRAYYNGKYYSYYGIAPVLTYYYPYYFVRGKLPSMNSASMFFGMLSIIFMYGAIMAFIRKFIEKPNFLLTLMCLIAAPFASGIYFTVDFSNMYSLPGITGTAWLMLCLWCGFEACVRHGEKKQTVLFVLSGLAFALSLASKPTRALSALIIAPLFLEILFSRKLKLKSKAIAVASFMIPVLAGCGAIMAYNNARFDSPFEFGAVYQLTVSNVQANSLRINMIPDSILHYFFQPIRMVGTFPFVEIGGVWMANRQAYIYSDFSIGALTMPVIAAGMVLFPMLLWHQRKRRGEKFRWNNIRIKNATYLLMFAMSVFLGWFNYCVAGVILSYVCDLLPVITMLAVFVVIDSQQQTIRVPQVAGKTVVVLSAACALTVFVVFLELLSLKGIAFHQCMPELIYKMEDVFCFWN